jgi:hypothetical protein
MKKNMKKLTLAKETLHTLSNLSSVRGGRSELSNCNSCNPLHTCPNEYSGSECTNC